MKSIVSYNKNDNQVSVALDKVIGDDNSYEDLLVMTVNGNVFTLKFDEYTILNNLTAALIDDES